jgi:hypothetical protein
VPDDIVRACAPPPVVSIPFTVNVELPEKLTSVSNVTVIPEGIITTSVESKNPGTLPPSHVLDAVKLPDAVAVNVSPCALSYIDATINVRNPILLNKFVKIRIKSILMVKKSVQSFFKTFSMRLVKICVPSAMG